MNPHLSSGNFSQVYWPGVGDRDECWMLSDLMAVHAVAPWVSLPTAPKYRAAAGRPDQPGPTGGSIPHSLKAIRTLWPKIGALVSVCYGSTWQGFLDKMPADRVASVSVLSASLPRWLSYGFDGTHRVAIAHVNSGWLIANPLAPPHARWQDITRAQLEKAMKDYPATGVYAIVMPAVERAIKTHPLWP